MYMTKGNMRDREGNSRKEVGGGGGGGGISTLQSLSICAIRFVCKFPFLTFSYIMKFTKNVIALFCLKNPTVFKCLNPKTR